MIWWPILLVLLWTLAYFGTSLHLVTLAVAAWLGAYGFFAGLAMLTQALLWSAFILIFLPLNIPWLRQRLISRRLYRGMQQILPPMSQTEKEALEAGDTWWDAELFSGRPDWNRLHSLPPARLSDDEQAFLDGPVDQLCAMLDEWDITHNRHDLPPKVWQFIKEKKFFGMIIPKQYGGLDFSNYAHSEVVMKVSSRSVSAAVTVMVPNSLGPAKLLLEYGTQAQKDYYLPRLAIGKEVPCFALTGPHAGSDAGAMPDTGVVCHGEFNGQTKVLGLRLNWEKRYITLGPVATVLGLAFKLYDPDGLLGDKKDIGITLALIPTDTPGVSIGNRHYPLDSAFQNGPNRGKDVFIPMDWVIGGQEQVGNGWRMLMECLTDGRALSLPALSTGAAKFTCRNSGAYARIRKQFGRAIGEFEGIEELLARMAGEAYLMDAARKVTVAALDHGEKPSVISAIVKYQLTERMRRVVNDGMDIQGGSGICLGPMNYLGRVYQVIPISITVEGANVLTRTLMIFGQGAVRCHPFIQDEFQALQEGESPKTLRQFDTALFGHMGHVLRNIITSAWLGMTNARFLKITDDEQLAPYARGISRLSVGFAVVADFALLTLGGALKRKERLSGRFADVLSHLYLASCVLKQYQDQGKPKEDLPLLHWACKQLLYDAEQALWSLFELLPMPPLGTILRSSVFPRGRRFAPPEDALVHQLAQILVTESATRDRLTQGVYINDKADDPTGRIEQAFAASLAAVPIEDKLRQARKQGTLEKMDDEQLITTALEKDIITVSEAQVLKRAEEARLAAITVDEFEPDAL